MTDNSDCKLCSRRLVEGSYENLGVHRTCFNKASKCSLCNSLKHITDEHLESEQIIRNVRRMSR